MAFTNSLWMGDLESYMNEHFIVEAFEKYKEKVLNVKLLTSKENKNFSGARQLGYCFVEFPDIEAAQRAMLRLNGKTIPGSAPPKRFKLNHAIYGKNKELSPEFSLYVGKLSEEVDDENLYKAFSIFTSIKTAKVVRDSDGNSKGFGFVRFSSEKDQLRAVEEMNGKRAVGKRHIIVSLAIPKSKNNKEQRESAMFDYYQQYRQSYDEYYKNWTASQYQYPVPQGTNPNTYYNYNMAQPVYDQSMEYADPNAVMPEDDLETLEDPDIDPDVNEENEKYTTESLEFYEAMEDSRWNPLDTIISKVNTKSL